MSEMNKLDSRLLISIRRKHSQISGRIFIYKLLALVAILSSGGSLVLQEAIILKLLGGMFLGLMFAHMLELQHQCLHGTAFKSELLNKLFGFTLGLPMLVSFEHYRRDHLFHHKYCGTPTDREFFTEHRLTEKPGFLKFLSIIFSLKRPGKALTSMCRSWVPSKINPETASNLVRNDYRIISLVVVAVVTMFFVFSRADLTLVAWILPMAFISGPLHFLIEAPEHFLCDNTSKNPLMNTRSITGSWFSFWFTNGNNYHVEHHLFPQISIDHLPKIHRKLYPSLVNRTESYRQILIRLFLNQGARI